jgi:hypothetical protein
LNTRDFSDAVLQEFLFKDRERVTGTDRLSRTGAEDFAGVYRADEALDYHSYASSTI